MSNTEAEQKIGSTTEVRKKVQWPYAPLVDEAEYALAIFRLQDEAGLGFKEARAVLMPHQLAKALAEEWGCTVENVYNLSRNGRDKVKKFTGDDPKKNEEMMPTRMRIIL